MIIHQEEWVSGAVTYETSLFLLSLWCRVMLMTSEEFVLRVAPPPPVDFYFEGSYWCCL